MYKIFSKLDGGLPFAAYGSVESLADLNTALADGDPIIDISITAGFGVTSTITIPAGKNVILNGVGDITLTRAAGFKGAMIDVANGNLTIENLKLNGNKASAGVCAGSIINAYNSNVTLEGAEVFGNSCAKGGGIKASNASTVVLDGGTFIHDNEAVQTGGEGGGVYIGNHHTPAYVGTNSTLAINYADINDNKAQNGGGVYAGYANVLLDGGRVARNTATAADSYGGGLYIGVGANFVMKKGDIDGNTSWSGGGIFIETPSASPHYIYGGMLRNNTATSNNVFRGGGAINLGNFAELYVSGAQFIKNSAPNADGGAIYTPNTTVVAFDVGNKSRLHIAADVKFGCNVAIKGAAILEADKAKCDTYVDTHDVTAPYSYAWNNLDVNYRNQVENDDGTICVHKFELLNIYYANGGSGELPPEPEATDAEDCDPNEVVMGYERGTRPSANMPPIPQMPYCTFTGWFLDPDNDSRPYNPDAPATGNLTIYAHWTPKPGYETMESACVTPCPAGTILDTGTGTCVQAIAPPAPAPWLPAGNRTLVATCRQTCARRSRRQYYIGT
ncbi:MAG: hypothetical protein LBD16_05485 [Oscillospiraceae bacterium]|jgi:uncharacterized repeat protein (TIGR02543 family)|nr:hypothetical protein [Oscillospiraceae bacterium]